MLMFELLEEVDDWSEIMRDILCAQGVTLSKVPTSLARFVQRLAAPRVADRYASAEDAMVALQAVRDTLCR